MRSLQSTVGLVLPTANMDHMSGSDKSVIMQRAEKSGLHNALVYMTVRKNKMFTDIIVTLLHI